MKIISAKDYQALSRAAANIISAQVILKPSCVLGLATGSSPVGTYQQLIEWYKKGDLDFSQVRTVNLDEYVGLDKDHDQSYAYFMRTNLFDHINVDPANTNIPDGMAPDEAEECARFASIDEVPTHARTMGTREILQARRVLMVASGANKAQAIKDAFFGPVTPQVPASILQYHPDFTLVADEAALSLL